MVFDNQFIVAGDPRTQQLSWDNLRLIFTQDYWYPRGAGGLYRPLTTLSYAFNYAVLGNGAAPLGYHVMNMALHFLNVSLAFGLVERMGIRRWTAAVIAAIYGVHPLLVESVTNIVGRADLLAAAAILGALHLHATARDAAGRLRRDRLVLLGAVTLAGLLCKENVAILIALLPLWDVVLHAERTNHGMTRDVVSVLRRRTMAAWCVVVPVVVAVFSMRRTLMDTWALPPMAVIDNPLRSVDIVTRELTALKILLRSVGLMLCPVWLSCDYSFDQIPLATWRDPEAWGGLAVIAALVALAAFGWRRQRALVFLIGFFVLTLLPTSNVMVVIDSVMAERFLYLPLLGFVGAIVVVLDPMLHATSLGKALVAGAVVLLVARTAVRNRDWHTDLTLWTSASEVAPQSFRVHKQLAWTLFTADEGLEHQSADVIIAELEQALAILGRLPVADQDKAAYLYLAIVARAEADRRGHTDEMAAETYYQKALQALKNARTIDRLMNERHLARERERGRSLADIRDVGQPRIYQELGDVLDRLGHRNDAIEAYREMLHLAPDDPTGLRRIARTELAAGHRDAAAVALAQLLLMGAGGSQIGDAILEVYADVDCGETLAVLRSGETFRLNESCPRVRSYICAALRDLEDMARQAKLLRRATSAHQILVEHECSTE